MCLCHTVRASILAHIAHFQNSSQKFVTLSNDSFPLRRSRLLTNLTSPPKLARKQMIHLRYQMRKAQASNSASKSST